METTEVSQKEVGGSQCGMERQRQSVKAGAAVGNGNKILYFVSEYVWTVHVGE